MIKLIVSDVDGTLVPDGSPDLDPEVFDIILKLREKGMQFVVASGRPWASVESAFEPVKKKIFYVANNGAYVGCHGRCLYAYTMERELAHRIIRKVRMHPELEMVYAGVNGDYLDSKDDTLCDWLTNGYKFNVIRVKDVLELEEPCVKISIYKKEGIEAATRDIYDEFKDQAKMACAGDMWMDCMAKDVNKGKAVRTIRKAWALRWRRPWPLAISSTI